MNTRKRKVNIKKIRKNHRKSLKIYKGGRENVKVGRNANIEATGSDATIEAKGSDKNMQKIMENIEAKNKADLDKINPFPSGFDVLAGVNGFLADKIKNITQGLFIKSIELVGAYTDVDLFDKDYLNDKLDKLYIVVTDSETKEKIKQIMPELAEYGIILIEAGKPFMKKFVNEGAVVLTDVMGKLGESGVKILLDASESIPLWGAAIGMARLLNTSAIAFISSANAVNKGIELSSNTMNATMQNFKKIMDEKKQLGENVNQSINNFSKTSAIKQ